MTYTRLTMYNSRAMKNEVVYNLVNSNTADGFIDPFKGSMNPSAVLEFSKMYKFIVKFVVFSFAEVTQLKLTK